MLTISFHHVLILLLESTEWLEQDTLEQWMLLTSIAHITVRGMLVGLYSKGIGISLCTQILGPYRRFDIMEK